MRAQSIARRLCLLLLALPLLAAAPAAPRASFPTPDAGVEALVAALQAKDRDRLKSLFGADGMATILSGDPVSDETDRSQFLAAYAAKHALDIKGETATLSIGTSDWPFPIPLAHSTEGWSFDVKAGEEEILNRRIGANELYTQQVLLAYADAQFEYAGAFHDGRRIHVYAQRLMSTPGKQDGLYWPTEDGKPQSPLGALVAEANAAGYRPGEGPAQPYHGYFYKILTAQGPNAPGGAYDYKVNGLLLGGFAAVAWPANWGHSGIMSFMINQAGEVYQKDLGPNTQALAKAMTRFNPDAGWTKIGAPAPIPGEADD
jgi:hypothetical protein